MIKPIGPLEPTGKHTPIHTSKELLPTPQEFQLPKTFPQPAHKTEVALPTDEKLDHAKRLLKECPAQATIEVLNQKALPEGEKILQEQAGLCLVRAISSFRG